MTSSENVNFFDQCSSPVGIGSELYNLVLGFYYSEAQLLDNLRFKEWGDTLAEDLKYSVPLRQTRLVKEQESSVIHSMRHMYDDYRSIMGRVMRLSGESAWAEDPASRVRRFVSNVQVYATTKPDELCVVSYLLITRNRFDDDHFDLIPCERRDLLRVSGDSFKLANREVILDQVLLGTPNLAIFL
ncbi:3-phenylpropionate/cinnamic acid dioxygenase subunit beta [Aestuariicella hydrocarbonica]|uniref:3-phenylpropionate/cinnamic acid dioxygenase subunit beta n=1 Tax=Pseudomaricurvus hydrocarbonicus TaxID=1470433 RepID=A0A9E5K0X3_9GAMM|nr:3-phenylpropionate/cinnamic acid dioxygenase subunit beta [Aestuariicella hydrocarbonica]NHO66692.1 3-phenylpropionate/cinnamic acid dioxygenase subunit beta [Aestuariicella hydrocarbonica]